MFSFGGRSCYAYLKCVASSFVCRNFTGRSEVTLFSFSFVRVSLALLFADARPQQLRAMMRSLGILMRGHLAGILILFAVMAIAVSIFPPRLMSVCVFAITCVQQFIALSLFASTQISKCGYPAQA